MIYSLHLRPPNTPTPIQNAIKIHASPPASIDVYPIVAAIPGVGLGVADPTTEESRDDALDTALLADADIDDDDDEIAESTRETEDEAEGGEEEESMIVVLVTGADIDCVAL